VTLINKNYNGILDGTAGRKPDLSHIEQYLGSEFEKELTGHTDTTRRGLILEVQSWIEACDYNIALQTIVQQVLDPTNELLESNAPWALVKTDKNAAKRVLFNAVQSLRIASILLKPFIPRSAEKIYTSFNFPTPWAEVKYADAAELKAQPADLRVTAELIDGKVPPLFPRIG
jgi:methionyl-tRNA synthetase